MEVNSKKVCFGARNDTYGAFTMQYSGNIMSFKLVHLSGNLTCSNTLTSFWGCSENDKLRTFLTNESNAVVFLQDNDITAYTLPGMHSDSPELTFNNRSVPLRVVSGQEFRVWYDEDLKDVSEHDNGGETCMKIYVLYV